MTKQNKQKDTALQGGHWSWKVLETKWGLQSIIIFWYLANPFIERYISMNLVVLQVVP